jgi:hypothetical protein
MIVGALDRSSRRGLDFENFVFDGLIGRRNISPTRVRQYFPFGNIDRFDEFSIDLI